ncbi:M20 family metallopeptidase [Thalassotalea litorea]|uniref:M20 family metallopeptidase n=1 Tax=Thalassotalea litorea TaxID=2020715 RepID=A0A5R9IPH8_9GAMM|nr:M20/M25/M40 family metallo-hydrolase [Thalassotalea litorea]TLU66383.1 M20 family metallopeptidase [Thalassotalea litorea]
MTQNINRLLSGLLFAFCLFSAALSFSTLAAENLNPDERAIVSAVQTQLSRHVTLLEDSVNINSGTMNFSGVRKVGELFKKQFTELGFEVEWLSGDGFERAGHLQASKISGEPNAPKILMIGHLDTVFAVNDEFQQYKQLADNKVSGPGIVDMKGGDVIIIAALKALKDTGLLDNVSIRVVMTGDEERSGRPLSLSKKAIIDGGKWADIALGFENGDSDINTAMVARRSSIGWELTVTGKPAHSSQIFREDIGYGAIFEASRILTQFQEQLSERENLTFNPGMFVGGTTISHDPQTSSGTAFGKSNVIAKDAKVIGGIRALSLAQLQQAQKDMQAIVAKSLPHTQATLTFKDGYPPMSPHQGNQQLLALYSQVSTDLGYNKVVAANPRKAGAADISFAANHVDMALDGLGLMGCCGHTKDEVADMSSFSKNIEKAAVLIYRLSNAN